MTKKIEEAGISLIVLAILVGGVAMPIFTNTSTTGFTTQQALVWIAVPTIVFAGIIMAVLTHLRSGKR